MTVTLTGSGLHDFSTVNCRFGDDTIYPATHIDLRASWRRHALGALAAVSRAGLQADFSSALPSCSWGYAVVSGVPLTDAGRVLQQAAGAATNELGYFRRPRAARRLRIWAETDRLVVELPPPAGAVGLEGVV